MSRKNKTIQLSAKAFLLSMGLTLIACGGGGDPGGNGNGAPPASVKYTGEENEANIDSDATAVEITKAFILANEKNVGGIAISGGAGGSVPVSGVTLESQAQAPLDDRSKNIIFEQLRQQVISTLNNSTVASVTGFGAVTIGNCVLNGVDGITNDGSVSTTIFTNTNTESSGKFTFNNLCRFDATTNSYAILNGDVYFTVISNSMKLNIPGLSVYFKVLTNDNEFTETISLYVSFVSENDTDGFPTKLTTSISSTVDIAGIVYKFEAIAIFNFSNSSLSDTVKFYHPAYGSITYVDNLNYDYATCGNLPIGGRFTIITSTLTYTIRPSGSCDNEYSVSI